MKKDGYKTQVIFLIEQDVDEIEGEVFAYFNKYQYYNEGHALFNKTFTSYAHTGQHSACSLDYAKECKEATPEQYADLKTELENLGYNLDVVTKSVIK